MKRIYIAAAILMAVAITEGCMKQRVATGAARQGTRLQKHI